MTDPILGLARNIFKKKYQELLAMRNGLRAKKAAARATVDLKRLKDFEALVAELGKNFRKSEKVLLEIKQLLKNY